VPHDVAPKIKQQTIWLAVGLAGAAANHLHVKPGRHGRAQQRNQIDPRCVKSGGEHIAAGQGSDRADAERREYLLALFAQRLSGDGRATNPAGAQLVADVLGVVDAAAEHQPGAAVGAEADDLVDRALDQLLLVGGALELPGNELASALADAGSVDPGGVDSGLRYQRREPAVLDRLPDAVRIDQCAKQFVIALVEAAAIEAIWRCGEPGNAHAGMDRAQAADDLVIHPGADFGIRCASSTIRRLRHPAARGSRNTD
jgi:hypothetical protein